MAGQTAPRFTSVRNSNTPLAARHPMPAKLPSQAATGMPRVRKYSIRLALPANQAPNATSAVDHQLDRSEYQKSGRGASHISGHHGVSPLPNQTNTAVAANTAAAEITFRVSFADSIQVPPRRTMNHLAEFLLRRGHPAAEIQHH